MKIYICEICGDAYIGEEKPSDCPFCGAPDNFIKSGAEANPIINQTEEISEESKKYLTETFNLEIKANAVYSCMAANADTYERQAMYKRLARIEFEHAVIAAKLLKREAPQTIAGECSQDDAENFKATIKLEEHATNLYAEFMKLAKETHVRIFFNALSQAEHGHIELIKNYLA